MAQKCFVCDRGTIFYIWTTSRNFPIGKLIKKNGITDKRTIKIIQKQGYPVCIGCFNNLKDGVI